MRNQISPEQDGQKGLVELLRAERLPSKRVAYWVISQLALCCPEKVPLLQSRATTPVVIGTMLMLIIGLALPWVPLGQILGFVHLPATYSLWVVFVVAAYLLTVQGVKHLYRQRIGSWL